MNETDFVELLQTFLAGNLDEDDPFLVDILKVRTFRESGLLTMNAGLVVQTRDGSEFQMTIIKRN